MGLMEFFYGIELMNIVILVAGILLIIVEMFHPGFGVPGITGLSLLVLGVILTARNLMEAAVLIAVILVILGLVLAFVWKSATTGRLSKKLVLKDALNKESGYIGGEDRSHLVGMEGITLSVLRPAGSADIGGVRMDVVADGEFLANGVRIKIVKVEGHRIVVRAVPPVLDH